MVYRVILSSRYQKYGETVTVDVLAKNNTDAIQHALRTAKKGGIKHKLVLESVRKWY